ncbi:MAG: Crp/Fnr family transcriptional regulator [Aquabacterium sp.]|nr:Crp/Fnr family transcriptional regulator [Aquabacterium sp.]
MHRHHSPSQNNLLAAIPKAEYGPFFDDLELVPMKLGQILYEPGVQMRHAYFPTTAVVSLHYVNEAGSSAEMAAVGREGLIGMALFMGGGTTTSSAMVRTAGHGYQLGRNALMQAFMDNGAVQRLLLRYTQALITQITQTAVCNRHHSIEQQLSTWLLSSVDRSPPGELVITHDLVGGILGVRRESISQAAVTLRDAGYISYRRGHITVLDHAGLEASACECYGVVKKELHRLLTEPALR